MSKKISQQELARMNLLREIMHLKRELERVDSHFQQASDPDLIDCYIYEMNAIHQRYKFLLREMREYHLTSAEVPCKMN